MSAWEYTAEIELAEKASVGSALKYPQNYPSADLTREHFHNKSLGVIWEAVGIVLAKNVPLDVVTLSYQLASTGHLQAVGGEPALVGLLANVTKSDTFVFYSDMVREAWLNRQIGQVGGVITALGTARMSSQEKLTRLSECVTELYSKSGRKLKTAYEEGQAELERLAYAKEHGLQAGLPSGVGLERYVAGGIPRDKVTVLFGESGNFKTTLKANIVDAITRDGIGSVIDFSMEDGADLMARRSLSRNSGISIEKIQNSKTTSEEDRKLRETLEKHRPEMSRTILTGELPPTMGEVIQRARQYKHSHGVCAVFVDYLQLLDYKGRTERDALDDAVKQAHRCATHDKIAFVLLSQVKRDVATRANPRPEMFDLFGCSSMQFMSKLAVATFCPSKYSTVPEKGSPYETMWHNHPRGREIYAGTVELIIRKNIIGGINKTVYTYCNYSTGKLVPLESELGSELDE